MKIITKEYLRQNPDHVFVFGDNIARRGKGGAAILRDESNTYGFITKEFPNNSTGSFYTINEYRRIYKYEIFKLKVELHSNSDKLYLISKLGAGLANKFHIFEEIIELNIKNDLKDFKNVKFLW
jgi:hypothetical protein